MFCSNCGEENNKGKFCCECGNLLLDSKTYNTEEDKNKYTTKVESNSEKIVDLKSEDALSEAEIDVKEVFIEPSIKEEKAEKEEEVFNNITIRELGEYVNLSEDNNERISVDFGEDVEAFSDEFNDFERATINVVDIHDDDFLGLEEVEEEKIIFENIEVFKDKNSYTQDIKIINSEMEENKESKLSEETKEVVIESKETEIVEENIEAVNIEKEVKVKEEKLNTTQAEVKVSTNKISEEVVEKNKLSTVIKTEGNKSVDVKQNDINKEAKNLVNEVEPTNRVDEVEKNDVIQEEIEKSIKEENNALSSQSKFGKDKLDKDLISKIKKKVKINKKVIASGGIIVSALIIGALAINPIKAKYYLKKIESTNVSIERLQYATKAVQASNNSKTREALEDALERTINIDVKIVDNKLDEMNSILSEDQYKSLVEKIKNLEINYYCDNTEYREALMQLDKINSVGANFKKNINYSDMMLYSINDLIDSSIEKVDTINNGKASIIVKENVDNDDFEEIINIEKEASSEEIKLNLYKYINGSYNSIDTLTISKSSYKTITNTEIYYYKSNESALYLQYKDSSNNIIVNVINVEDGRIKIRNTVKCDKYVFIQDVDNDGRYEIGSSKTSSSNAENWYRLNEDGTTSNLILDKKDTINSNSSESNKNTTNDKEISKNNKTESVKDNGYILVDSNKKYLTDSDVSGLSKSELFLARNEIFARHGYVFTSAKNINYFKNKVWYKEDKSYSGSESTLNKYEKANIELIKKWENK